MRFDLTHDFDLALDALELAVVSPDLGDKLAARLTSMKLVEQRQHAIDLEAKRLERTWSFRPTFPLPAFARDKVTLEQLSWDELWRYDLASHAATFTIKPHAKEGDRWFSAQGTYRLERLGEDRARRRVEGELHVHVPVLGTIAERLLLTEIKKTFDQEADVLRDLVTLV